MTLSDQLVTLYKTEIEKNKKQTKEHLCQQQKK
jgi:hypothetical protein